MPEFICTTCGTQFKATQKEPANCPICEDERQYVPPAGQRWTTLTKLQSSHRNQIQKKEKGIYGIGTVPKFGIGQRALLIRTEEANILWDCLSLIDEATVDLIKGLGGLDAIAISHPHYYGSMRSWSKAFGDIPVFIHKNDRPWVMNPGKHARFWDGKSHKLTNKLTLVCLGGHFPGGTVLHHASAADGRGALCTGDIIQVVADRKHVSFMYSYPNLIPLSPSSVKTITHRLQEYRFDRIYGAWWERNIMSGGEKALATSARRYIQAIDEISK